MRNRQLSAVLDRHISTFRPTRRPLVRHPARCRPPISTNSYARAWRDAAGSHQSAARQGGLDAVEWTPHELRRSFVSLLSYGSETIEQIADLCGHAGTSVTEPVYRHQLRPVLLIGAGRHGPHPRRAGRRWQLATLLTHTEDQRGHIVEIEMASELCRDDRI
jgi:integrase